MPEVNLEQLKFPAFRHAPTNDEYVLYRAALDWSLDDPIAIERREDLKSEVQWKDLVDPYNHQVRNLLTFCRRLPVTLLADDVGLGKTISAGLIASELMARKRVTRILVVCPKILGPQWKEELETKFGIPSIVATGNELLSAKHAEERHAVITTYNSARLYIDQLPVDHFQMLILDEAHKLRNLYGTDQAPQVATKIRSVLSERMFKYVLMLTATPIQNRLWDLYSLVDLLSVARGHENPFGIPGMFARNYIADEKEKARRLKLEKKEEFQSIVYGYMSRIRRGDANLIFPDRRVLLHPVQPSSIEIELLKFLTKNIVSLPYLSQIGILKAFTSSPHAVLSFCNSMARNNTAPKELAFGVRDIVSRMQGFTKLHALGQLVHRLAKERPEDWRAVIFTTSRETQTSIQELLVAMKVRCALINGQTSQQNTDTIGRFKREPPEINVIVSTEAGAEGVNLQAANVLINFDLPWNPMIVEQRIGRIQRLGSKHDAVSIYNMVLAGTFDEFIVGRLIEKLHMAAHAIGDIEALLETANLGDEEKGGEDFEEMIRKLVLASLQGQDVETATRRIEDSISLAKTELKEQAETIERTLGSMDDAGPTGPRSPKLPPIDRQLPADEFAVQGLEYLGCKLAGNSDGTIAAEIEGRPQTIVVQGVDPPNERKWMDYRPGASAFDRLAQRLSATAFSRLSIIENAGVPAVEALAKDWCKSFGGEFIGQDLSRARVSFDGNVLARVRVFVAHDSCERIVQIRCDPRHHSLEIQKDQPSQLTKSRKLPEHIGLQTARLLASIEAEPAINEFSRFYEDRKVDEMAAAVGDARKARKLQDDFTPRLDCSVVGIEGTAAIEFSTKVHHKIGTSFTYQSVLQLGREGQDITFKPDIAICQKSGRKGPVDCLGRCEISGTVNLLEYLNASGHSGRMALKEHLVHCAESDIALLSDEADISDVTGKTVAKHLLQKSALSGKLAEKRHFGRCEFSQTDVLRDEMAISTISAKAFRSDRMKKSMLTGIEGDISEFVTCELTGKLVGTSETETCATSGSVVARGELVTCELSGKKVVPSQLLVCAVSGTEATIEHFVRSSISGKPALVDNALTSIAGNHCTLSEAALCMWSEQRWHPEDMKECSHSGLTVHSDFTIGDPVRIVGVEKLIATHSGGTNTKRFWGYAEEALAETTAFKNATITAAIFNEGATLIACTATIKTLLGLRKRNLIFCYSLKERGVIGTPKIFSG